MKFIHSATFPLRPAWTAVDSHNRRFVIGLFCRICIPGRKDKQNKTFRNLTKVVKIWISCSFETLF